MSMLELDVKLPELDGLVKALGLEEGGRAQQHLVKNVARRITKYVPKRTYSSIENAIAQGQEPVSYTHLDVYKRQVRAEVTLWH